ncbi:MAG: hypothetical protein K2R98_21795 [Gemmataceae bacterium]|nr:hypothetical protein [Gemmataceae bacterium]
MYADVEEMKAIAALPALIARMEERFREEASPEEIPELWAYTYVAMGLRYPVAVVNDVLRHVMPLIESSRIYESILAKGRIKGYRESILIRGREKFGQPDEVTANALQRITDEEQLGRIGDRLTDSCSWQELLGDEQ